jgi:hypothetical protein
MNVTLMKVAGCDLECKQRFPASFALGVNAGTSIAFLGEGSLAIRDAQAQIEENM